MKFVSGRKWTIFEYLEGQFFWYWWGHRIKIIGSGRGPIIVANGDLWRQVESEWNRPTRERRKRKGNEDAHNNVTSAVRLITGRLMLLLPSHFIFSCREEDIWYCSLQATTKLPSKSFGHQKWSEVCVQRKENEFAALRDNTTVC